MLGIISQKVLCSNLTIHHTRTLHISVKLFDNKKAVSKKYSHTLFLPSTSFPARLEGKKRIERDKQIYEECEFSQQYKWQKDNRKDGEFILHDGPPYANGSPHIGHAMNKILKDITIRFECSQGKKVDYITGWDCHGLPIELKAIKGGKKLPPIKIREIAEKFALGAVNTQKEQFSKWGILTDWDNIYKTLDKSYVKRQIEVFSELFKKNLVFQNYMPVFWSPSSRTALAEAELEYNPNHKSTSVYVRFKMSELSTKLKKYEGKSLYALIWTTTPWSLLANQAICFHEKEEYNILQHKYNLYLVAKKLIDDVNIVAALPEAVVLDTMLGADLQGCHYNHPLDQDISRPFLHGYHVLMSSGTGLVHTAPAHGQDDFKIGLSNNLNLECLVDEDGCYVSSVGNGLAGLDIQGDGAERILELLKNDILLKNDYIHSYPYDWRTKKPVFLRASKQWFINTDKLKPAALKAIEDVIIHPATAKTTLQSVVENRPYWCISRQRVWGTKIPVIYDKRTDEPVISDELVSVYLDLIDKHDTGFWWTLGLDEILAGTSYDHNDYRLGNDILDIWFDSGISWSSVLGKQADVYLEGLDQFSGWFYTSLLTSVALTNKAPYKEVFVHGFTLDEKGNKMSKSIGNVVDPQDIIEGTKSKPAKGVDVLRWWVGLHASSGSSVPVGENILNASQLEVNKIRNSLKFFVGMLGNYKVENNLDYKDLVLLDKILLQKLKTFQDKCESFYKSREYNKVCLATLSLVADISATHLHLAKDRLYCDEEGSLTRNSGLTGLYFFTQGLLGCLSPILPFLSEEAANSVSCLESPTKLGWFSDSVCQDLRINESLSVLEDIRGMINKETKKPLEFHAIIKMNADVLDKIKYYPLDEVAEVLGVLSVKYKQNYQEAAEPQLERSNLEACERCRRLTAHPGTCLCSRCFAVIQALPFEP